MIDKLNNIVNDWSAKLKEPYFVLSVAGQLSFPRYFPATGGIVSQALVYLFRRGEGRTKFLDGYSLQAEGGEIGENGWAYTVAHVSTNVQNQPENVAAKLDEALERLEAFPGKA